VLEFVAGDRFAGFDAAAGEFIADDRQLFTREPEIQFRTSPDRARFLARENRRRGRASQSQANCAQYTFRAPLGRGARLERSDFYRLHLSLRRSCFCLRYGRKTS
jgi:hypothetical protein